jgi:hypothetical protein
MEIDKRSRAELKQYFVMNAIPTDQNFAELIDGMLNQKEDGIAKLPGNPLSIEASGDDTSQKKVLHFYKSFADPDPTWVLSLNPRQNPNDPATAKPGLSIGDSAGNSRLFIDRDTSKLGLGTITPRGKLDVPQGDVFVGKTLNISAPADSYDGGVLNIINETSKKYWHIDIRANEADKLIFWRNDGSGSTSPWLAALKLGMDGTVEAPCGLSVQGVVGVSATATTWGGWLEAIRFNRTEHSAITHPGGKLLFGMHSDRNFYFSDTDAGRHLAVISPANAGSLGIGTNGAPGYPLHVKSTTSDWQARFENPSSNSNVYLSHGGGHGMHVRTDTASTGNYLLELYNATQGGSLFHVATSGDVRIAKTLKVGGYGTGAASVNASSLEVGGPDPTTKNGQATIFLHHHGKIAHQLRYAVGTLYLEAAGNGYGTNPRPALALGGDVSLEGKHAFRGNDSWLRLNQDSQFASGVYTPGILRVDGDVQIGGKHAFRGNDSWLRLNQDSQFSSGVYTPTNLRVDGEIHLHGSQFYAPGRMHINGEEICYILNKSGVIIGKDWGGNGSLSVQGSKNFHIDHPLDPDRFLVHSVVEGPEAAVFYRGEAVLVDGECEIDLPPYFEALTRKDNRTVLVTPKLSEQGETSALAAGGVVDGKFLVRAIDGRNRNQRFYWEVKGVRADIDPIHVEPMKTDFPAPPRRRDDKP